MEKRKDYYKILGVSKDATPAELKSAYKKLVLKWHPDRNPGNKDAEEKFKEIAEAWSVLSDPEKRKEYDNPASSFQYTGPNFGGMDMDDILHQFGFGGSDNARGGFDPFGGFDDFFGGGRSQRSERTIRKGSSLKIRLSLSLTDILNGCHRKIRYKRYVPCDKCGGTGADGEPRYERCLYCGGTGQIFRQQGNMQIITTCPECQGKGKKLKNPCPKCNGTGIYLSAQETEIDVPKGVHEGMSMPISGMGNAPDHNQGVNGDLIVEFSESKDKVFTRDGKNLLFELNIPVVDAILGCNKEITTIDGKKLVAKIASKTENGQNIKFRGYGLPEYGDDKRGDMIAVIKLTMPKKLNADEIALLNQLKEMEDFK